jgi:signal transduction histidine kinase
VYVKAARESGPHGRPAKTFGVMQDVTEHHLVLDRVHQLSAHLETVREEERARIAREIHDELGQQLTGLKLTAAAVGRLLGSSPAKVQLGKAQRELASLGNGLSTTIRTVQRIATELRPRVLDTLGLIPALDWLRQSFERDHAIRCMGNFENLDTNKQVATTVFRVAQEALTNVAKHTRATQVHMRLYQRDASLILEIEDNGEGLPADRLSAASPSLGVVGMRERAWQLNGELDLLKAAGRGLLVRLTLPQPVSERSHGTAS